MRRQDGCVPCAVPLVAVVGPGLAGLATAPGPLGTTRNEALSSLTICRCVKALCLASRGLPALAATICYTPCGRDFHCRRIELSPRWRCADDPTVLLRCCWSLCLDLDEMSRDSHLFDFLLHMRSFVMRADHALLLGVESGTYLSNHKAIMGPLRAGQGIVISSERVAPTVFCLCRSQCDASRRSWVRRRQETPGRGALHG